ncbi:hypothetical protein BGZ65_011722, partial [Modicella reniformis]
MDPELWENVSDEIRNSGIIGDVQDYHGNFNADTFSHIFTRVCKNLVEMGVIYMDGASYHFFKADKNPTTSSTVDEIKAWMARLGYEDSIARKTKVAPEKLTKDPSKAEVVAEWAAVFWKDPMFVGG